MKIVATFFAILAFMWFSGAAWCYETGLQVSGEGQVLLLIMCLFVSANCTAVIAATSLES